MKKRKVALPYVDNIFAVLITLLINLAIVFLFNWPDGITYTGALWDSLFCAAITVTVDMVVVYVCLKRMKTSHTLPVHAPVSAFMQKLPKNPLLLALVYIVVFGVLTVGINALVLWFFGMTSMAFVPWLAYKLIYAVILSMYITQFIIFRYVQPDWAAPKGAEPKVQQGVAEEPVKNPLPRISIFKELYGSVTGNLALNLILGTALGGVVIDAGSEVIIHPTTVQGIPVTGLIFGLIMGALVTNGVINAVNTGILAAPQDGSGELPKAKRWLTWMPKRKGSLICLICACLMIFSSVALWSLMTLFQISIMNFFQYTVFITIYAAIMGKIITALLLRRCTQPDYIVRLLKKKESREQKAQETEAKEKETVSR